MFFDPEPDESPFERYDLLMLIGYGTIAWAVCTSLNLGHYFSS